MKTALVLVDIQNDFMPGGALAVPDGDAVVAVANRLARRYDLVVATQDWHPPDHGSFASNHPGKEPYDVTTLAGLDQVLWPDHCVQGTPGAAFVDGLDTEAITEVFRKGTDPSIDSYSGFFDNGHRKATGMGDWLKARGVERLVVVGVATDYCVQFTARDGAALGFETWVVEEGIRGVGVSPDDVPAALAAMGEAGCHVVPESALPA